MKSLFISTLLSLVFSAAGFASGENPNARTLVHLLDYLASDYGGAVKNGKVVSQAEHKEHLELIQSAVELLNKDAELKTPELQSQITDLQNKIIKVASETEIAAGSQKIKAEIIAKTNMEIAPREWPNLSKGREIFESQCASCHGLQGHGDGPAAKNLNPKPFNFLDKKEMAEISPFKIFNAARVGIKGTAMAPFPTVSDKDLWAVAFYVASLQSSEATAAQIIEQKDLQNYFKEASSQVSLEVVANSSDPQILAQIKNSKESQKLLAALRLHSNQEDAEGKLALAANLLNDSLNDYRNGKTESAKNKALSAYLEGIEPVEPRIKARDPKALVEIEKNMADVRSTIERNSPASEVEGKVKFTLGEIRKIDKLISETNSSPSFTFFMASSILFREAFEAVLVIIALLGVIRATGAKNAAHWVHAGWILAVAVGAALWIFSGVLLQISGAGREMMEGIVSIIAVLMLLYMGFWLHSKTEIGRWNAFIKTKVENAIGKGSLFGLALISFAAVGREAVEVVLFLRTIWIENGSQDDLRNAMAAGVAFAFVAVFVLSWFLVKYSAKIPIRKLFAYSSLIMSMLAFIMIGKGLHSIQEAGRISITDIPIDFRIDLLGVFPTVETLVSQIILIGLIVVLWKAGKKPTLKSA